MLLPFGLSLRARAEPIRATWLAAVFAATLKPTVFPFMSYLIRSASAVVAGL